MKTLDEMIGADENLRTMIRVALVLVIVFLALLVLGQLATMALIVLAGLRAMFDFHGGLAAFIVLCLVMVGVVTWISRVRMRQAQVSWYGSRPGGMR